MSIHKIQIFKRNAFVMFVVLNLLIVYLIYFYVFIFWEFSRNKRQIGLKKLKKKAVVHAINVRYFRNN